jgi:hypothetical protein
MRVAICRRALEDGAINVAAAATSGHDENGLPQRDWHGRMTAAGKYTGSPRHSQEAILSALRAIAEDPAAAARLYGQEPGRCCFCGIELTDGASIAVGYGPVCAERFGHPMAGTKA